MASLARQAVADEMGERYVLAARARGLTRAQVLWRHVLKNVLTVCLTVVSYDFLFVFTGYAIAVETVFDWPGVGRLAVQAALQHDLTLLTSAVIVTGFIIAVANIVVDVVHAMIDRRAVPN